MSRPAPTVACVSQPYKEWFNRVFTLATSLRNLGGKTASAPLNALFVGQVDGLHASLLATMGVVTKVVQPWPSTRPHTNKLRMLEEAEVEPDGVLVGLDCDVVILRDFSEVLTTSTLRATPAWESPMRPERWHQVIDDMGLKPSQEPYTMVGTGEKVPAPYMNSGVLFVPAHMIDDLKQAWAKYVARLDAGRYDLDPAVELYYLDQIALAMALLDTGLPVEPLGQEWHVHTKKDLDEFGVGDLGTVYIAEYHRWVDQDGLLKRPRFDPLVPDVTRLNAVIAARRGLPARRNPATRMGAVVQRAGEMVRRELARGQ